MWSICASCTAVLRLGAWLHGVSAFGVPMHRCTAAYTHLCDILCVFGPPLHGCRGVQVHLSLDAPVCWCVRTGMHCCVHAFNAPCKCTWCACAWLRWCLGAGMRQAGLRCRFGCTQGCGGVGTSTLRWLGAQVHLGMAHSYPGCGCTSASALWCVTRLSFGCTNAQVCDAQVHLCAFDPSGEGAFDLWVYLAHTVLHAGVWCVHGCVGLMPSPVP